MPHQRILYPATQIVTAAAPDPEARRVLVIAPTPFFGDRGCHVRILEEVRGLQARGADVLVATYATGNDVAGVRTAGAPNVPGLRAPALGPSYGRPFLDTLLLGTTLRAARRFRPDIVHAHLHEGIAVGLIAARLVGSPLVADLQGSLQSELVDHRFLRNGGLRSALVGRVERWLVRQPAALLASSNMGARLLADQNVDPARIVSLPDGVDLTRFRPMPPDPAQVDRLGLRDKRVIVFLGVLTAYQGVDTLIAAASRVVESVPNVHFLIMGYPNEEHYRGVVSRRGLDRHVTFPGRIPYDDAAQWLNLGTVAVSAKTSLTESNGKLLNYMACGLPVVATDTPVNRELLGEAGIYAAVDDPTALAARLSELLRAPARARAVGATLRRRVEQEFSWPFLTERLLRVYERLLTDTTAAAA